MTDQILLSEVTTRISIHFQDVHINFEATDNAMQWFYYWMYVNGIWNPLLVATTLSKLTIINL